MNFPQDQRRHSHIGHNSDNDIAEQFRLSCEEWARLDGEARRKDALRKRIFAQLVIAADAKSVAMAENLARVDPRYEMAEADSINAETAANIAKADMEAVRIRFEVWRTRNANARAEMNLR